MIDGEQGHIIILRSGIYRAKVNLHNGHYKGCITGMPVRGCFEASTFIEAQGEFLKLIKNIETLAPGGHIPIIPSINHLSQI